MENNILKEIARSIIRFYYRCTLEYTLHNYMVRKNYKERLLSFKDIHKGKRCFIIGNGPSLTAEDLTLLKDEYTFAANRIFYMFDKTEWRPTYYCAQDDVVVRDIADKFDIILTNCKYAFIAACCDKFLQKDVINNEKVLLYFDIFQQCHKGRIFSERIDDYVFDGSTVTYAAIQIAAYMGFSEIFLIGVDHNYSASSFKGNSINDKDVKSSYFEGMPSGIKMTKPNTDGSTLSFVKAKEYADAHKILIANATRGGKLEVFPRVKLEDVIIE